MLSKLRQASLDLPYLGRAFRLIWRAARRLTLVWSLLLLLQGVLPVATVYLTKWLVDGLASAVGAGFSWQNARALLVLAGLMAVVLLLGEVVQGALEWVRTAQSELIADHVTGLIHAQSAGVDLAFYDSPEFYDNLHRARSEAASRCQALLESSGSLAQNSVTLLAMGAVLIPYGVWLPVALLVATFPALVVVMKNNHEYHRWWESTATDRRWAQYYDLLLTNSAGAAELRLFGLGGFFSSAYQELRARLRSERLRLIKGQSISRLAAGAFALIVSTLAMTWMISRVLLGMFTLGDLALSYQAYTRGQGLLRTLLGNVGQVYANSLFLRNLYDFLDLKPRVLEPADPGALPRRLQHGIRLEGVTFRYPDSERLVIRDFDLFLPAGRIVALVGPNGAGKSTLIKLLCRFYDPDAGKITLDGIDLRQLPSEELRRRITVMFQLPVPYYATAARNIEFGQLDPGASRSAVEGAARSAGVHDIIAALPHGYDTMLGRLFAGGTELSVGEWQRLALARAYFRKAEIMILDEPTSSMDPWAEVEWMSRFRSLAEGCTALIITHRFTTAKHADLIYVMQGGKIVESGSHTKLLGQDGLYARSWDEQVRAAGEAVTG